MNRPGVGIGVMVVQGGKVLMSKRRGSHGAGEYAYPGGHIESGESFEECARREVGEETGLEIKNIKFLRLANVVRYGKHYIDIALTAEWAGGEPKLLEPEKAESWAWYDFNDLPEPMFYFCYSAFDAYKTGQNYYDLES